MRWNWILVGAIVCGLGRAAEATTFPPMTFGDLVGRADTIFVGDVTDVRAYAVQTPEGTTVRTRVVFSVRDAIWGTASSLEILEFLGGEAGDLQVSVAEMPQFAIGDRRLVFAYRKRSINPIVGFTQGVMQVRPDAAGVARVLTLGNEPVGRVEDLGRPHTLAATPAMTLQDIRARIVRELAGRAR